MKNKIIWLVVSGLIVLLLVMAACAPAVVEKPKPEVVEKPKLEVVEQPKVVEPEMEKPKYGGVLKIGWTSTPSKWHPFEPNPSGPPRSLIHEFLYSGDWAKGPAGGYGTNETDWTGHYTIWELNTGYLAENWEYPTKIEGDTATVIYHIRKGVHWALNPASEASRFVGGREMTVDDVLFSLRESITNKQAYIYKSNPAQKVAKITSPAPWTVKIEVPWDVLNETINRLGGYVPIAPPEAYTKYDMNEWIHSVGTGPFMVTNFVPEVSVSFVRNPNYWMKDPIGPGKGNQLPYLDGVRFIGIPDRSTMYAALRTAKVDWIGGDNVEIYIEDKVSLEKTTQQLKSKGNALTRTTEGIAMRLDKPPFNDIRVRRAMMMAIDFEAIKRDYYRDEAQILTWPIPYVKEYAGAYLGLDDPEMPASVKELYVYNPTKAKQLIAEAGYPNGFKTSLVTSASPQKIDYWSIYKDMWRKVGIDMELLPKESAVFSTHREGRNFDAMIDGYLPKVAQIYEMAEFHDPTKWRNQSAIDDPIVNEAWPKIQAAAGLGNNAEANRLYRELMKHVLDQA